MKQITKDICQHLSDNPLLEEGRHDTKNYSVICINNMARRPDLVMMVYDIDQLGFDGFRDLMDIATYLLCDDDSGMMNEDTDPNAYSVNIAIYDEHERPAWGMPLNPLDSKLTGYIWLQLEDWG